MALPATSYVLHVAVYIMMFLSSKPFLILLSLSVICKSLQTSVFLLISPVAFTLWMKIEFSLTPLELASRKRFDYIVHVTINFMESSSISIYVQMRLLIQSASNYNRMILTTSKLSFGRPPIMWNPNIAGPLMGLPLNLYQKTSKNCRSLFQPDSGRPWHRF